MHAEVHASKAGGPRSGRCSRARHRARKWVELAESAVVVDPSGEIGPTLSSDKWWSIRAMNFEKSLETVADARM